MKDYKGKYQVIRIITEEHLLADELNLEDAIAIVDHRASDQTDRDYSYEVRVVGSSTPHYTKQAHGEA